MNHNTKFVMALYMVASDDGLEVKHIKRLLLKLSDKRKYVPIEFTGENSTAIGFIDVGYFEQHDYKNDSISEQIIEILDDMELESPEGIYDTPDGSQFYMGYCNE